MTQFNIDVVVNTRPVERGMDRVDRRLEKTSQKSKKLINATATKRALRAIQTEVDATGNKIAGAFDTKFLRGLFGFTGLGIVVREILQLGDAFTDAQNRLRLLVDGEEELTQKTRRLFEIARETRSSFTGTAALYQRVGLAAKSLGQDSADLERVVTNVNRAIILSGASAKEANNGLIQLAQGIAANRLSGDELRSVLEQLPKVADVIAKSMTETNLALGKTGKDALVTRGQLRDLGAQGKITGEVVLKAFDNLATTDKLAAQFAKTVPTLSQALTVLGNSTIDVFASLNQGVPIMTGLAQATLLLADSLKVLAGAALAAAPLALVAAWQTYGASIRAAKADQITAAATSKLLAQAELAEATATVEAATAQVAQAKATLAQARAGSAYLGVVIAETEATEALALANLELEAAQTRQLGAIGRIDAATQRAGKPVGILATIFAKLKGALVAMTNAILSPVGAIAALAGIGISLRAFRSELESSQTVFGRMAIAINAGIDKIRDGLAPLGEFVREAFQDVGEIIEDVFSADTFDRLAESAIRASFVVKNAFRSTEAIEEQDKQARKLAVGLGELGREVKTMADFQVAAYKLSVRTSQARAAETKATEDAAEAAANLAEALDTLTTKQEDQIRYLQDQIKGGKEYADIIKAQVAAQRAAEGAGLTLDDATRAQVGSNQRLIGALTAVNSVLRGAETEVQKLQRQMDLVSLAFERGKINAQTFDTAMAILTQSMSKANEESRKTKDTFGELQTEIEDSITELLDAVEVGQAYADAQTMIREANREAADGAAKLTESQEDLVRTLVAAREGLSIYRDLLDGSVTPLQEYQQQTLYLKAALDEGLLSFEQYQAAVALAAKALDEASEEAESAVAPFDEVRRAIVDSINEMQNAIRTGESYAAAQVLIRDANRELKDKGLAPLTTEQKEQIRTLTEAEAGLRAYKDAVDAAVSPLTAYERQQVSVKAALDANIITLEEYNHFLTLTQANFAALDATPMTFHERLAEGVANSMSSIEEISIAALNRTADAGGQIVTNTLNLMGEMARTGEDRWREAFNGMLGILRNTVNQMIADLIRLQIQQAIVGMLGGGTMNAFNPATSSAVPNASFGGGLIPISGTRAHGGTVHGSSKPYLVGEEGPELFFPGRTGTVMPNPETMKALMGTQAPAGAAAPSNVNVAAPQVNLTNVLDSQEIVSRGLSDDMIVEAIERNSARIQSTLN